MLPAQSCYSRLMMRYRWLSCSRAAWIPSLPSTRDGACGVVWCGVVGMVFADPQMLTMPRAPGCVDFCFMLPIV